MGGKTSTTTQAVQIPQEVLDRYNSINARAEGVANNPFKQYSTDPSAFVAQINQQQQTGINNVNAAVGSYRPYFSSATDATKAGMASANPGQLNIDQYMNPFQQRERRRSNLLIRLWGSYYPRLTLVYIADSVQYPPLPH